VQAGACVVVLALLALCAWGKVAELTSAAA
jgi:hypothetical protein